MFATPPISVLPLLGESEQHANCVDDCVRSSGSKLKDLVKYFLGLI